MTEADCSLARHPRGQSRVSDVRLQGRGRGPPGKRGTQIMATLIADTACVDPRAELADDVEIGPYCIVGPDVKIGRGTHLIGHVCLLGHTTLGQFNTISPFTVIGGDPQDASYKGSATRVEIGDHNI